MELIQDWKGFQSVFEKRSKEATPLGQGPLYLIVDGDRICSAFSETEDLTSWSGASCKEMERRYKHREIFTFERGAIEKWLYEAAAEQPGFYNQVDFLRKKAIESQPKSADLVFPEHFLLQSLQGWWAKVLPTSYGVYLHLEGTPERDFILLLKQGRVVAFHEPDLSSLGAERRQNQLEVVRTLSEKYLAPFQGLFVSAADWEIASRSDTPWKEVASFLRSNRLRLQPFRWTIATLIATRAFLGV